MESWSFLSDEKGLPSSNSAFTNCPTLPAFSRRSRLLVSVQPPPDMVQTFRELGDPQRQSPFESDDQIAEPNRRDSSSVVDLKLRRLDGAKNHGPLQQSESSKRVRPSTTNTQTAYCQVYGCNKDLTSSKEYHRRHRVCEVHSKTATVIVNGIQQRFCQQCSRFHLIAEFDEGKRSCRKRLAGHNQRRRKPLAPARPARLLQSYIGNRLRGNTFVPTSFICPEMLPNVKTQLKIEYQTNECGPLSPIPIPIPIDQIHTENPVSGYTLFDKHLSFYQDSSSSSSLGGGVDYFSSSIHGQLGSSGHGRALSLLSPQSQNLNSSTQSSGFSTVMAEISSSFAEDQNYHRTGSDDSMKFEVLERIMNRKEDRATTTISLSQLSSQLQRIETQRQSLQF